MSFDTELFSTTLNRELPYLFEQRPVMEIRAILSSRLKHHTLHGYFDSPDAALEPIQALNKDGYQIYYTLNYIEPQRFSLTNGFVGGGATKDADITKRLRLLVDIDPVRPAGTSATKAERQHAWRVAFRLRDSLMTSYGFPTCETVMSGNGYQHLWKLDLEVSEETTTLISRCLKALDRMVTVHLV